MKLASLFLLLFTLQSCQDYNANTFDRDRYGVVQLTGSSCFKAAYPVLQQYCMNCHFHSSWSEYTNQSDWLTNQRVVPDQVSDSKLVTRIVNYGGASSDMPQGQSALPPDEYEKIRVWVETYSSCP